jgi:hypothetical protein
LDAERCEARGAVVSGGGGAGRLVRRPKAFRGGLLRRFVEAQLVVDESWALAGGGSARFDRRILLGVGCTLYVAWVGGTAVGALAGQAIGNPSKFGLDGAFAALFTALLAAQLRDRTPVAVASAGAAIAALPIPFTAPGAPIIVATAAVLIGWRRKSPRRSRATGHSSWMRASEGSSPVSSPSRCGCLSGRSSSPAPLQRRQSV